LPVNLPKDGNNPGVFSGACIGKIEGCSFTFNIHREKEESPKPAKSKNRRIIINDDSDSDYLTKRNPSSLDNTFG